MRRGTILAALSLAALPTLAPAGASAAEPQLRADVEALCAFDGRGNGSAGLDGAAAYVEGRMSTLGLTPAADGAYRQEFPGPQGESLVNLAGLLGDPEAPRHVVIAAHVDHLGREGNTVYPGADDNASGVAVLLDVARRLAPEALDHAVLFLVFSGEEIGLRGSAHYTRNPLLPLERCTAMINLDTVGRMTGPLTVFGTETAAELPRIVEGVNVVFGLPLDLPAKDPGGSDQASFTARGVPALQLFTGANADYHRPTDTPDRIVYDGLERIAEFTAELGLYLARRGEPLTFVPPGAASVAAPAGPPREERRVSFGSIPDFNHAGAGILLSGVIPGSPAEQAGLRPGDLIVRFAGVEIEDLRSFSDVLRGLAPGDSVEVEYVRDGTSHTVGSSVVERK